MLHLNKALFGESATDAQLDEVKAALWLALGEGAEGRALLAALPVAIYTTDVEGRLTFCNAAASRFWGTTPALGEPVFDQWRMLDAEGGALPWARSPLAVALRTGAAVCGAEGAAMRRDGSRADFSSDPTPLFDAEGRLIGAADVLVDRSAQRAAEAELRESRAHYRHAIELNPQMPWTADPDGAILHTSERWSRLTGQTREEALGNGWLAVADAGDLDAVRASIAASLAGGVPIDIRFRIVTADGARRWVRARARPRRDEAGAIVRWYGSTEDIHDAVTAEQALVQAEERYRYAALATKDVFWDHDLLTDRINWSGGLRETFGHTPGPDTSAAGFWLGHIHDQDRTRVEASFRDAVEAGASRWTAEYRFRRADGSYAHVLDCGSLLRDGDQVVRAIGAMLDISERKETEAELRLSEERLRLATAAAGLGICDFAIGGREHWSDELRRIMGVAPDMPATMQTYLSLVHPDDLPGALEQNRRTRAGDFGHGFRATRRIIRASDGALRWISTEGHILRNEAARVFRVIITVRDITDEKQAQDQVSWAATHDAMTGLPNKAAFQRALEQMVADTPAGAVASLLLVDLDNFKHVNDTLGHQAGDTLLIDVGARLRAALPAGAKLARFGGDEFAIVLAGTDEVAAAAVGADLLAALRQPCMVDARSVDVRASIGVAAYPRHGGDASTLLQAADLALYAAKAAGRHAVLCFDSPMRAGLQRQVSMLRMARTALADGSVVPFYQPKVTLAAPRVVGAEALLRWRHARHGLQSAGSISAAFDDPELGAQVGDAMLSAVLADMRDWLHAGQPIGRVAINVSPVEIGKPGYSDRLLAALTGFAVPAAALEIEITETTLMGVAVDQVVDELALLRAAGVTVALDDFGTGYSSLSHLARFPVDVIKIDRTFVAGLTRTRADKAVVEAVLGLSVALGLSTVAEGVETPDQADALRRLGCDLAQGFLFSPPVAADALDWRQRFQPLSGTCR